MIMLKLMRADLSTIRAVRQQKKGQCKLPLKYDNCFYVFCFQLIVFSI